MSKIIKGIYFAKTSLLNARVPANASWFWKSVTSARYPLEYGLRKRIGDGKSMDIWEDKWIPRSHNGRVSTLKPHQCEVIKVSQ